VGFVVEIDDDLFDQQAHDALFGAGIGLECVPDPRQVLGETQQGVAVDPRPRLDLVVQPGNASLQSRAALEGRVPARLELARDVPLGRSTCS
jgi:hypothetical protein